VKDFVGREQEIATISATLAAGTNVLLSGKFGIGRTSLMHRVAAECDGRLRFVFGSCSRTPAAVCSQLASQISPPRRSWRRVDEVAYRKARRRLLDAARHAAPPVVFVLDDVAKMTAARWNFAQFLSSEPSLRIVVIVESLLPEVDVTRLRACLYPSIHLRLGRLPALRSHEFFERVSGRVGIGWSRDQIRGLAVRGGGYPLAMVEAAVEAVNRRRGR